MADNENNLDLERCPHCQIDRPNLNKIWDGETNDISGQNTRSWNLFACVRCGGVVVVAIAEGNGEVYEIYPPINDVETEIPFPAGEYLAQAIESTHAPAGAVLLCASAVDAMLREKGYTTDGLNSRIQEAIKNGLLTQDMGKWAYQVRLDLNDRRRNDPRSVLPSAEEAQRTIDFTRMLGEFLFELPVRVQKGIQESSEKLQGDGDEEQPSAASGSTRRSEPAGVGDDS